MANTKEVYLFDDNYFYNGVSQAQLDPVAYEMGRVEWLMPPRSVDIAPAERDGFFSKWNSENSSWDFVKKPESLDDLAGLDISHTDMSSHGHELREIMRNLQAADTDRLYSVVLDDNTKQWIVEKLPEPTEEELAAKALQEAKSERASAVSKIVVEVDGMEFDGDEDAQTRMGRTISAAVALGEDLTTTTRIWVLADNTVAAVTVAQLAKALQLAGDAQTALWTVPYQD
jgi:hypothetical protein